MARPPEANGIRKDDIPEAPGWLEKLLRPLNLYMQQVGQALNSNLTVRENLAARWVTVAAVGDTLPKPFEVGLGGRPAHGVLLVSCTGSTTAPPTFEWEASTVRIAGGQYAPAVTITRLSGLTPGASVSLRFLVLAE